MPSPVDPIELADWFLQTTHVGFVALDALAHGVLPGDWSEAAEGLAAAHAVLLESPPRLHGIVVLDDDVVALAKLRTLVAGTDSGVVGAEVRGLAAMVRAGFDRRPEARAA